MSTAYTACIDDPVYMRWREAEAEEWANIQQPCLAPDNTDTDTDTENSNNTDTNDGTEADDDDQWSLHGVMMFALLLLWLRPSVEQYLK